MDEAARHTMRTTMYEVLAEIERQIAWRGPNARTMGHIVIERAEMIVLVEAIRNMEAVLNRDEEAGSLADEVIAGEKSG